jgi:putative aldouronate transport system permease protein
MMIWKRMRQDRVLLLMLLPIVVFYILFKYLPIAGILIAFKDYNLFRGVMESKWVGWKYFHMFLNNPDFFELIRNTLLLGIYKLAFGFPIPILFALLLNEVRFQVVKRFVQSVSYMPHFISNVVVAGMVVMFLSPSGGPINQLLEAIGLEKVNFLSMPEWFRTIYVSSEIWQHMGWETIIYLAALTAVDPGLYEAARMDGASRLRQMFHISLPGIAPAIVIMLLLNIGNVLEIGFEKVYLLYTPSTYSTADIISTYVYRVGLVQGNYSYATAIDVFTGFISFFFVYTANAVSRKFGENSLW